MKTTYYDLYVLLTVRWLPIAKDLSNYNTDKGSGEWGDNVHLGENWTLNVKTHNFSLLFKHKSWYPVIWCLKPTKLWPLQHWQHDNEACCWYSLTIIDVVLRVSCKHLLLWFQVWVHVAQMMKMQCSLSNSSTQIGQEWENELIRTANYFLPFKSVKWDSFVRAHELGIPLEIHIWLVQNLPSFTMRHDEVSWCPTETPDEGQLWIQRFPQYQHQLPHIDFLF